MTRDGTMARAASPFARPEGGAGSRHAAWRQHAGRLLRGAMEAGVLLLACLAPWAFGAVGPKFEFLLYVGVAALLVLWAARILLEGQLSWRKCPVAVCLGALVLAGAWQVTPLPRGVLGWLS